MLKKACDVKLGLVLDVQCASASDTSEGGGDAMIGAPGSNPLGVDAKDALDFGLVEICGEVGALDFGRAADESQRSVSDGAQRLDRGRRSAPRLGADLRHIVPVPAGTNLSKGKDGEGATEIDRIPTRQEVEAAWKGSPSSE